MHYKFKISGIVLSSILCSSTSSAEGINKQKEKPNFIIINCDDLGYGDLGCFGHPTIKTPNLDRMACEGQRWSSFYVSASVSSPSRAGLLTGRLGVRTGMYGNNREVLFPDSPQGLPQDEHTIAGLLKKAGYISACVGKWHVGHKEEALPLAHGFDYFYGIPYSNDMSKKEQLIMGNNYYSSELPFYDQLQVIERDPDQTQFTKRLTEYAVSFIQKEKNKPFFLYLAHPMPHIPLYSSESFQGKSIRGKYGDAVEEIDWSVGQILQALRKQGLDNKTLVLFTSDNGPWLTFALDGGSAGLLKDGKASTCEGGFRVPCIFWGSMVTPGTMAGMGSSLDILPTFCEMADIKLPEGRIYDGTSLQNVLSRKEETRRNIFPFFRGNELYAFRKGKYKVHFISRAAYGSGDKTYHATPLLYDIENDPGELYNIASKHPDIVKNITTEAQEYLSGIQIKNSIFDLPAEK
ncbi:arylsulfatase A [Parabacteroides sp. PF5-5]|uniref:sulfatase family protein n=1 Tax=unclassified Parabacteroides TaxID=2649774 RepID=UPI002473A4F1|nr:MULTISPECIES: sulfatase [unclassified Parabacteroides]MDH6306363.1 arylsulfatase A [Parabacteroides sp. PH5-39]MDH6314635.1 arylsulfatase A [Parabacteroides sp. PF5-13]MDH6321074.1 arylsulfatase A [Parabacteroides sp. PH5-13]MDH6324806.1 arylsulfatase A [Parabacteroides sp. PH5-8]MDH6325513.1 arylsulfatase A [Parabacteroides sp. PH5-41]